MKQVQVKARIIKNIKIGKEYAKITVLLPEIAKTALPGQFVMVQVRCGLEPMLRRPLGIHRVNSEEFGVGSLELLYEIVGKGTKILSQRKPGEYINIIGPLGNGFNFGTQKHKNTKTQILVAGGMGVAPLGFLAEKLKGRKPLVLIGAKTKGHIHCENEFKKFGCVVKIATDDGSKGFKGRVTDLLRSVIARSEATKQSNGIASQPLAARNDELVIFACGPKPMLKALSELTIKYNIPTQISLEAHMSCGFGACLGCVVDTKEGYKRVCKDGPVFEAREIIW